MVKDLGIIDLKILHVLMANANKQRIVRMNGCDIARAIGYKRSGGAITYALKYLISTKRIARVEKWTYKVLV